MILSVSKCPNCDAPMRMFFLEYNNESLYLGTEGCPRCHTVHLSKDTIDEINKFIANKTKGETDV